ncbi:MAG: hypothetical protein K5770_09455 [Lachnospiraceae bacterium]|nr:hypothetical protein [Lachnospiraceae bacterium]
MTVIILAIIVNFILYYLFGTVVLYKKGVKPHFMYRIMVGFFAYYAVFFVFCVPVMKYYRPLSMLTGIWTVAAAVISLAGVLLIIRERLQKPVNAPGSEGRKDGYLSLAGVKAAVSWIKNNPLFFAGMAVLILIQIILVSCTYNFTLDAAYYVAGISTNIDTNMINVYDPFTGAWQDHFEMRYFFATYSVQDAVVCQLTGISPLIWTKSVMSTVIIILTNMVYYLIASELFDTGILSGRKEDEQFAPHDDEMTRRKKNTAVFLMMAVMLFINVTFNTIYTSSLFLMTRTYEGKAIVGNLGIFSIFLLFIKMNDNDETGLIKPWLCVFLICFGASTVSSTANMLMPVELTVLFLPLIIRKKSYGWIPKYIACVMPGIILSLAFVLYVKGYFVFYTYPR